MTTHTTHQGTYPHLFRPLTLGAHTSPHTLRNRIVMGSMHTGLEEDLADIPALTAYYVERAKGGVGMIITGGYSPNTQGVLMPGGALMNSAHHAQAHAPLTAAVHEHDTLILMQLLHAGRYSATTQPVSASDTPSPINPVPPRALTQQEIEQTIQDYAQAAYTAQTAGYDGIEIMGGEGYLINQFLAERTNQRTDQWGSSAENRRRFPLEITRAIRKKCGPEFLISFRLSMADFVPQGQTEQEILDLAAALEQAGANLINTDLGWHESRVPTIVTSVPRAAFVEFTRRVKNHISIPVCVANRINMPEVAQNILENDSADLIQMARPLLADPCWAEKARTGQHALINTCIGCNQACLDQAFAHERVSCLVNPQACRETELVLAPTRHALNVAVVGAGPAGLSAAVTAAQCGHHVTLFESGQHIGGQFRYAAAIPGKEEFWETIRYYTQALEKYSVTVNLNTTATVDTLSKNFDEIILATGVTPRIPDIPGVNSETVRTYIQAITSPENVGERVAIIGAGGIGFDVAELLTMGEQGSPTLNIEHWKREWGVSMDPDIPGFLAQPQPDASPRSVSMLQRKTTPLGSGLNRTTGWVHRASVAMKGVQQYRGVNYQKIDSEGLHITTGPEHQNPQVIPADTIVLCSGQISSAELSQELDAAGIGHHIIGGALRASEVDARRAIREGAELGAGL